MFPAADANSLSPLLDTKSRFKGLRKAIARTRNVQFRVSQTRKFAFSSLAAIQHRVEREISIFQILRLSLIIFEATIARLARRTEENSLWKFLWIGREKVKMKISQFHSSLVMISAPAISSSFTIPLSRSSSQTLWFIKLKVKNGVESTPRCRASSEKDAKKKLFSAFPFHSCQIHCWILFSPPLTLSTWSHLSLSLMQ